MVVEGVDIGGVGLGEEVCFFGCEHDVGGFEISVNEVVVVKFLHPPQDLLKNLLYCELFLAGYDLIEVSCQPLHHHDWLLLPHKGVHYLRQVAGVQDLVDVPLADEANRQPHFAL